MVLVVGLLTVLGAVGFCEEQPTPEQVGEPEVVEATVEGRNFCLGCALKKEKGAKAQCSLFGHRHSLKVNKAVDMDGNELMEMKGWVLHYLETEKSKPLIDGHHGQEVTIEGKVYPLERVLEVEIFEQAGPIPEKAAAKVEQKTCPIMGGAINKNIFTEYRGKKVYFCCAACKPIFEKNPKKYLNKLPQFQQ